MKLNKNQKKEVEQGVSNFLEILGEDLYSDNIKDTPSRVAKSIDEMLNASDEKHFNDYTVFETNSENDLVSVQNIQFYSLCDHHLMPFFGKVDIGYIPKDKVLGLSKLPRLVKWASSRLSLQEDLTTLISNEMKRITGSDDVIVNIEARHTCMEMRGIRSMGSTTKTIKSNGRFKENNLRSEFFSQIESRKI